MQAKTSNSVGRALVRGEEVVGLPLPVTVNFTAVKLKQETQLMLTNRATRLEVSHSHRTCCHSIC